MSNKTDKKAQTVHGRDPQLLVEKIIRERIYESVYWKEECFGLNAETILDKAVEMNHVGGTFANQRPVHFLCLLLKLLQIQPTIPIVEEYIQQEDWKYLRLLGLFYLRLVGSSVNVYTHLEPYLADRRKVRLRQTSGEYVLSHMDEIVDELLTQERVFGLILPRLTKRTVLEDTEELEPRPLFFPIDQAIPMDDQRPFDDNLPKYRDRESLTVEETNELRKKLGLAPLV